MTMSKDIGWWIWKPSKWQAANGFKADEQRCRRFVSDGWGHRQCLRKPTMAIQGYGFCTQHGKMLERMGYEVDNA